MGYLKNKVLKVLQNVNMFASFTVERIEEGEIDYADNPDTNENYGTYIEGSTSEVSVDMNIQSLTDNDRKDTNIVDYEARGYLVKTFLKFKSLELLQETDIVVYADGFKYGIIEFNPRYLPNGSGGQEFVYCTGLLGRKEKQD